MLKWNNDYFMKLQKKADEWNRTEDERSYRKERIISEKGWEAEELNDWYEEEKARTYPISSGACKAWQAFRNTVRANGDELLLETFLTEEEVGDFVEALRKAGIRSFLFADQSTAVMRNIHALAAAGCVLNSRVISFLYLITYSPQGMKWPIRFHSDFVQIPTHKKSV